MGGKWLLQFVRDANQTINDIKPDIVHLHSSKAGFWVDF